MDIRLFNDLELLNRTGNFTQAAELANTSQPSFSRRIKALETWVGVTLVDRSRQPVKLTSAGFQMLEAGLQAKSVIEKERSQVRAALGIDGGRHGGVHGASEERVLSSASRSGVPTSAQRPV